MLDLVTLHRVENIYKCVFIELFAILKLGYRLGNSDADNASRDFLFASLKTVPWCIANVAITMSL